MFFFLKPLLVIANNKVVKYVSLAQYLLQPSGKTCVRPILYSYIELEGITLSRLKHFLPNKPDQSTKILFSGHAIKSHLPLEVITDNN